MNRHRNGVGWWILAMLLVLLLAFVVTRTSNASVVSPDNQARLTDTAAFGGIDFPPGGQLALKVEDGDMEILENIETWRGIEHIEYIVTQRDQSTDINVNNGGRDNNNRKSNNNVEYVVNLASGGAGMYPLPASPALGLEDLESLPENALRYESPCGDSSFQATGYSFSWTPETAWGSYGYHPGIDGYCSDGYMHSRFDGWVWYTNQNLPLSDWASVYLWVSGGTVLLITNVDGVYYIQVGGHLSNIGVQPGQKVSAGDIVGQIGNTGRSFGVHLHDGVGTIVNGKIYWFDPLRQLPTPDQLR